VQLTKEIGVRKVLGASIGNILYLFVKEFTMLVTFSYLLAAPLGYYVMQRWLNNFAYREDLGFGVFILAITLSLLIAFLTVGYKSLKASLINPITAIRTD
jgi:ABC-type antimicrobial peptide transport system permease subunit